jgi:gamma-glutamylcyclotransferase (GGCT)/AIG2-like uncharacterized protein YtfP
VKKNEYVFVYGTLRRGERADLAKQAHNFSVSYCGQDKINGKLYHLGSYPGLKLLPHYIEFNPTQPIVIGERFRIRDASIGAILDAYEGYDSEHPEQGLYNRVVVEAESGEQVWVYVYNPMVIEDQRIETGDWCKGRDHLMPRRGLIG